MEYFLIFVAGMAASMMILRWAINRAIDRILDRTAQKDEADTATTDTVNMELRVEFDQNTYFTYNAVTSAFVCQAATVQQLRERLIQLFPNQNATIVDGDPVVLNTIQQELANTK
jgi:hypothetical protein